MAAPVTQLASSSDLARAVLVLLLVALEHALFPLALQFLIDAVKLVIEKVWLEEIIFVEIAIGVVLVTLTALRLFSVIVGLLDNRKFLLVLLTV